jgi:hypothetical protein
MTIDPTAVDQTPLNQGAAESQHEGLPEGGLSEAAEEQVNSVEPDAFTERGNDAETAAFQEEGEYSGGEFAGGHLSE